METKLNYLLKPIAIGTMVIKNRLVMPAMISGYSDSSGYVTERLIDYYCERAKGGVGLIIVEASCVSPEGKRVPTQIAIYDNKFVPGLKRLTQAIHTDGAKCAMQIHHAGRQTFAQIINTQTVAPSSITPWGGDTPRELSLSEIEDLIAAFGLAAVRAREAGFDAIEVHCTHGYLIDQFLSPLTNKRTDKYGGSLENRMRFALEVFHSIREKAGADFPVIARITGDESIKGGITLKESQKIARRFVEEGVNALHVSSCYRASSEEGYLSQLYVVPTEPMSTPRGYMVHLAEGIKKVVNVPVICVGRLDNLEFAEHVLAEGKADMVALGRPLWTDPQILKKTLEEKSDEVRPCIACRMCNITVASAPDFNVLCTVNAEAGREKAYKIKPAERGKRILIIGGGPGGLEAARIAALRGHKVVIYEKERTLGGNLVPASAVSFKAMLRGFTAYLTTQINKLDIEVHISEEANLTTIEKEKPDVVIVATGSKPILPDIPGINSKMITNAIDVLTGKLDPKQKVVVVGAGMVGCETASYLAEKGRQVTLVTRRNSDFTMTGGLAPDMEPALRRWFIFDYWPKLDIDVIANATFHAIEDRGLIVIDQNNSKKLVEGQTIVFAIGYVPNNELTQSLKGEVTELYQVGDCVQPRKIINAVHEAAKIAHSI